MIKKKLKKLDYYVGNIVNRIYKKNFNKVFCIGLHKTGTTSLKHFFSVIGLKSHSGAYWSRKPIPNKIIGSNTAFSDGGGHVWFEELEFGGNHEVRLLNENYPNSKFILNTRSLRDWVVSKMMHAGWSSKTSTKKEKKFRSTKEVNNGKWKHKSLSMIEKWIINRKKYHEKAKHYLESKNKEILEIDITEETNPSKKILDHIGIKKVKIKKHINKIERAKNILSIGKKRYCKKNLPHLNKRKYKKKDKKFCNNIFDKVIENFESEYE
jgi:hypothetical protein